MNPFPTDDIAALRAGLYAGTCPVCRIGGWASVGHHVAKRHHISSRELKALLGIPVSHSLTSPEVRERAREIGRSMPERTAALVEGGRHSARAAHIGRAGTEGRRRGAAAAGRAKGVRHGKIPAADLPRICERIDAGERYRDVAADYGCSPSAVFYRVRTFRGGRGAGERL